MTVIKMAELLVRASTAIFSGTVEVILVFLVARVALIVDAEMVAAACAAEISAVPRSVEPLVAVTVEVQPVAVEGVTLNPSTV